MKWSRRDALKSAAALALAAGHVPARLTAQATRSVEFEFTGLFAIQHWMRTSRKLGVLLVKGKEPHTPQLLIRIKDVNTTTLTDFQVIHVGGEAYYLWNLTDRLIWVHDVQVDGYDKDSGTTLEFRSPNEWEKAENFAPLAKAVRKPNVHVKKPKKITAKILLTRGDALGVTPELDAELKRRYRICGNPDTAFKKYTSQLRVRHPAAADTLTLKVAAIDPGKIDIPTNIGAAIRTIILNTPLSTTTRVGVLNTASSHGGSIHFHEFFDVVDEKNKDLQFIPDEGASQPAPCTPMRPGSAPDSPFVGCIPPLFAQDAT